MAFPSDTKPFPINEDFPNEHLFFIPTDDPSYADLLGMYTTQNIIQSWYFWPTIFHECIHVVKQCDKCQLYANKARAPLALLHLVITVGPFCKWGIDFMNFHPPSSNGHKYIVVAIDYFTKWA
jgi:hypothetical protein